MAAKEKSVKKVFPELCNRIDHLRFNLGKVLAEMAVIFENGKPKSQAERFHELTLEFGRSYGLLAGMVYTAQQCCDAKVFAQLLRKTKIDEEELEELIAVATGEGHGPDASAFSA